MFLKGCYKAADIQETGLDELKAVNGLNRAKMHIIKEILEKHNAVIYSIRIDWSSSIV